MARTLQRGHTLYIEDSIWNVLVEHVARRDESASQFTNAVLREALGMIPHEADQYMPGFDPAPGFDGGKGLSIGFKPQDFGEQPASPGQKSVLKQTVHPGDPYEDIDLSPVPEHGLVSDSEVPEDSQF